MKKVLNKIFDSIIVFSCFFSIAMFIFIMVGSTRAAIDFYKIAGSTDVKMLWVGILAAVLYSVVHWIIDFTNQFTLSFKSLFNLNKNE